MPYCKPFLLVCSLSGCTGDLGLWEADNHKVARRHPRLQGTSQVKAGGWGSTAHQKDPQCVSSRAVGQVLPVETDSGQCDSPICRLEWDSAAISGSVLGLLQYCFPLTCLAPLYLDRSLLSWSGYVWATISIFRWCPIWARPWNLMVWGHGSGS